MFNHKLLLTIQGLYRLNFVLNYANIVFRYYHKVENISVSIHISLIHALD